MIEFIAIDNLFPHPNNPRIEPNQEIVEQIASQIKSKGGFDESHALIVRQNCHGYQIVSGHHRLLAAQKSGLSELPCWVREFTDEQAYMELVLCNTQSELHPLEEGKHAAESGMDLKAYAEATGKVRKTLSDKVLAFRVLSVAHVRHEEVRDAWRNLAEIHAAPRWLWAALVRRMIESKWTVAVTRESVGAFKDVGDPPTWVDGEKVAAALISGLIKPSEIGKMEAAVKEAKVRVEDDDRLHHWMMEALSDRMPSRLSEVQTIVAEWESKQAEKDRQAKQAEIDKQRSIESSMMRIANLRKNVSLEEWKTLSDEECSLLLFPETNEGGIFNKQDSKDIEWAQWSWNPVTGCKHDCSYCYARDIALSKRMEKIYPNGFAPTFRSNALNSPRNTKVPKEAATDARYKNVFTCSMADLFGRWVPKEWIDSVMLSVRGNPQWDFLFLTKFPQRLAEIDVPENAWMGTTVDLQARVANAEKAFQKVNCRVKWLSVEPMIEQLTFSSLEMFDWVVIGGASSSEKTPKWEPPYRWIESLVRQCDDAKVPVYMKSNLGIANRVLELPMGLPLTQDPQRAPEEMFYLGKQ